MTYNELCNALIAECEAGCDYVVKILCYYVSENGNVKYDVYESYEIFTPEFNDIIWFNDWYEGQQYCHYDNLIKFEDLIKAYNKPITYIDCANAMMKMWIDNVLIDSEYNRIMDKLNAKYKEGDII